MRRVTPDSLQKGWVALCCRSRCGRLTGLWNQSKYGCVLRCSEAACPWVRYADVAVPAAYSKWSRCFLGAKPVCGRNYSSSFDHERAKEAAQLRGVPEGLPGIKVSNTTVGGARVELSVAYCMWRE